MTECATTKWPRQMLDDLAELLASDSMWGQCSFSDERLSELLDDPRVAEPWPIQWPLPAGADLVRVFEASAAPCRLGEYARAVRRAAMSDAERAAGDAAARDRLMERRRALGMTSDVDPDLPLEVLAVATESAEWVHARLERSRWRSAGAR